MEIPDDIFLYICTIADISYTPYLRLINKKMHAFADQNFKLYKMIRNIDRHFAPINRLIMENRGLIEHTRILKSKTEISKDLLFENIHLIKNSYLCTYITQYHKRIQITRHSVIVNLL